jgi:hypothetical protein
LWLVCPFSLISTDGDRKLRFHRIGGHFPDSVSSPTRPPASVTYTTLQAEEGIAISADSAGTIERWDLSTGLPEILLQIPKEEDVIGAQLVNGTLTIVHRDRSLYSGWGVSTWDVGAGERLERKPLSGDLNILGPPANRDLGISTDGTTFFVVDLEKVRTWSISTGENTGSLPYRNYTTTLISVNLDGPMIWIWFLGKAQAWGWDLRNLGLPPLNSSNMPDRLRLACIRGVDGAWDKANKTKIIDAASRKEVFILPERFAHPDRVVWDGRYLFAVYETGEPLILDFVLMTVL